MDSQAICFSELPGSFARELSRVADNLDVARDADSFLLALKDNARLWKKLQLLQPLFGNAIPHHFVAFTMEMAHAGQTGLDDEEVEALIKINRRMSAEIFNVNV